MVEVEAPGYKSILRCPVAVLSKGTHAQLPLDLQFPDPPVTFKLIKGSGPVYLSGNHTIENSELKLLLHVLFYHPICGSEMVIFYQSECFIQIMLLWREF